MKRSSSIASIGYSGDVTWAIGTALVAFAVGAATAVGPLWLVVLPVGAISCVAAIRYVLAAKKATRRQTVSAELTHATLAIELVALPLVVSIRQRTWLTAALLLILLTISLARKRNYRGSLNLLPALLILSCVVLVCWRAILLGGEDRWRLYTIAGLFLAAAVVLLLAGTSVSRATAYASLLAGLSLYLVGNVAAWLLGVKSASSEVRLGGYEASDGLFGSKRVFFPFARAINEPAFMATMLLAGVAAMIAMGEAPRWYHWSGVVAGIVIVLASNSRSPVLFVIPIVVGIFLAPRMLRLLSPYVVGFILILPFLLGLLRPLIGSIAGVIAQNSYLARGQNATDIGGLGTRDVIWSRSLQFWQGNVLDGFHQFFGFGYNGHAESGALDTYVSGIGDFLAVRSALTMHNSMLQMLFDTGIVGATALYVAVIYIVYKYGRSAALMPMFAVALMVAFSGATEISLAPGFNQTPVFILLYLAVFVPSNGRELAAQKSPEPISEMGPRSDERSVVGR